MDRREELFWKKVAAPDERGCRKWLNELTSTGYGKVTYKGYRTTAHRMAYILTNGPIHADLVVMHDCDVRSCCNPDHLKAVTQKVNLADMRAKGRAGDCRNFGEKHGRCKLPTGKLDEVKAKYAAKQGSQTALAKEFGISQTHLSRIVRGVSRVQG